MITHSNYSLFIQKAMAQFIEIWGEILEKTETKFARLKLNLNA